MTSFSLAIVNAIAKLREGWPGQNYEGERASRGED